MKLFKSRVHHSSPARTKLSVHLKAQKPRPKRMSEAAVAAFSDSLEKDGIAVDTTKWREELFAHGEPFLTDVSAYWQRVLESEDSKSPQWVNDQLAKLATFAEAAPASSDYEGKLREGVVIVQDPKSYRAASRLTAPPKPVVEWGDLPSSKL